MNSVDKNLGFGYERKRIKIDKKLPPLCPDYEPEDSLGNCKKAKFCKSATYNREEQAWGLCYGGTKSSEREDRKNNLSLSKKEGAG